MFASFVNHLEDHYCELIINDIEGILRRYNPFVKLSWESLAKLVPRRECLFNFQVHWGLLYYSIQGYAVAATKERMLKYLCEEYDRLHPEIEEMGPLDEAQTTTSRA